MRRHTIALVYSLLLISCAAADDDRMYEVLRTTPLMSGTQKLGSIRTGDWVYAFERQANWVKIKDGSSDQVAWVSSKDLGDLRLSEDQAIQFKIAQDKLAEIAELIKQQESPALARQIVEKGELALAYLGAVNAERHPLGGQIHSGLARATFVLQQPEKAIEHMAACIRIFDRVYGQSHLRTKTSLAEFFYLLEQPGDPKAKIQHTRGIVSKLTAAQPGLSGVLPISVKYLLILIENRQFQEVITEVDSVISYARRSANMPAITKEQKKAVSEMLILCLNLKADSQNITSAPIQSQIATLEEVLPLEIEVFGHDDKMTKATKQQLAAAQQTIAKERNSVPASATMNKDANARAAAERNSVDELMEVSVPQAELKLGEKTIATIGQSTRLWKIENNGAWVQTIDPKSGQVGWISNASLKPVILTEQDRREMDLAFQVSDKIDAAMANEKVTPDLLEPAVGVIKIYSGVLGRDNPFVASALQRVGKLRLQLQPGDYQETLRDFRMAWVMHHDLEGPNSSLSLSALLDLADVQELAGDAENAIKSYRALIPGAEINPEAGSILLVCEANLIRCLVRHESPEAALDFVTQRLARTGLPHPDPEIRLGMLRNLQVNLLATMRRYDEAETAQLAHINDLKDRSGDTSEETLVAITRLANLKTQHQSFEQASDLHNQVLDILRTSSEPWAAAMIDRTLRDLVDSYQHSGDFSKAETFARERLRHVETNFPADSPAIVTATEEVIGFYKTFDPAEALRLAEQHVTTTRRVFPEDSPACAKAFETLAWTYVDVQDYSRAIATASQVVEIRRRLASQPNATASQYADLALALGQVAIFHRATGENELAIPLQQESVDQFTRAYGDMFPPTIQAIRSLANLEASTGRLKDGEDRLRTLLQKATASYGAEHEHVATILKELAEVVAKERSQDAVPLYEQALAVLTKLTDGEKGVPEIVGLQPWIARAEVLSILIDMSIDNNRQTADDYATQFNSIYELARTSRAIEPWHRDLMPYKLRITAAIAGSDFKHPDQTQGIQRLETAIAELRAEHPSENLDTLEMMLAASRAKAGQIDLSLKLANDLQQRQRRQLDRLLSMMSEQQQLGYLKHQYVATLPLALDLVSRFADHHPSAVSMAADWVLNSKAVQHEVLAELHEATTPEIARHVRELQVVRERLSQFTLKQPASAAQKTANAKLFESLSRREAELTARIAAGRQRNERDDPWVSIDSVQRSLPPNAALVTIMRTSATSLDTDEQSVFSPHDVAWIIRDSGRNIEYVDLGPANRIDKALASARNAIVATADKIKTDGEEAAEAAAQVELKKLSSLIWYPLEDKLDGVEKLYLSPDGALWMAPWSALLNRDATYLIESHELTFLLSGRELASDTTSSQSNLGTAVILADPAFGVRSKTNSRDAQHERSVAAPTQFARLPATAAEALAVKAGLLTAGITDVTVRLNDDASESWFKQMVAPEVLVLSTHGFFLPEPDVRLLPTLPDRNDRSPSADRDLQILQNPLLRCGLAMAGANQRTGSATATEQDGLLTGLEIAGMNLRGTKLVVLSACETGVGDIRNGEGVAGLRQAFHLAGAQTVISTLWNIADNETARLIGDLFQRRATGLTDADALRQAQLTRIKSRRDRFGAAHPFFWAAFALTGMNDQQKTQ
ncbi:MAG: CHAT domain-containing tetratricopeptide repeat protein [Planctomycetaceae bacterium]